MTDASDQQPEQKRRLSSLIDKLGLQGAESLGKNAFISTLALIVVVAWIFTIFMHIQTDQTLTNVVMILFGYFYGSSAGSKRKEDAVITQQAIDATEKKLASE